MLSNATCTGVSCLKFKVQLGYTINVQEGDCPMRHLHSFLTVSRVVRLKMSTGSNFFF